jgi:hypothetical protein
MAIALSRTASSEFESFPAELVDLYERVQSQPIAVREELGPLIEEAMEEARFRSRVLSVARGALEQFKLDLEMARFDLDATRRERETLLRMLDARLGESRGDDV